MKILVPTDFSKTSEKALVYAANFASKTGAEIILYHSYIPFESGFYSVSNTEVENRQTEKLLSGRLANILKKVKVGTEKSVPASYYLDKGPEIKNILEFIRSFKIDMVIMGTTGASGLKERLIGCVTATIIGKASCPVIAVPSKYKFRPISEIAFATDYKIEDFVELKRLRDLSKKLGANVSIWHFSAGEYSREYEDEMASVYQKIVLSFLRMPKMKFHAEQVSDIEEALSHISKRSDIDLLALITKEKTGFYKKLFSKNLAMKVAFHTRIPLLALPVKTVKPG